MSWGVLLAFCGGALANPVGPTVQAGGATVTQPNPTTVQVNQSTGKAVIDWRGFSIAPGETTRFVQPGADSVVLNRVTGNESSQLLGTMTANGQVYVVNRNGIVVGKDARIDVGSLVLSTSDIKNENFLAGKLQFDGKPAPGATVVNRGEITVADRGLAALVAPSVRNEGTITARVGQVVLGGAESFTLDPHGDGLFSFTIDKGSSAAGGEAAALVSNAGKIVAAGGVVQLSARTAETVVDRLIENTGVIEARSATRRGGTIVLDGGDPAADAPGAKAGGVVVGGMLDASGTEGGSVTARGTTVSVAPTAEIAAAGSAGDGGSVRLEGSEALSLAGNVSARGRGKGGKVVATADKVTLASTAKVDVSGGKGGGTVLVGGNERGQGPERNATTTRVETGAAIKADALESGDGGRVVVWSDGATAYGGVISARGAGSGTGGFAEVSGKEQLAYRGDADLRSESGRLGTLLLDPSTITIVASGENDGALPDISDKTGGAANYTLSADAVVAALNKSNVSLSATDGIFVNAAVDALGNLNTGNLTLTATGVESLVSISSMLRVNGELHVSAGDRILIGAPITTFGAQSYTAGTVLIGDADINTLGGALTINGNLLIQAISSPQITLNTTANGGAGGGRILIDGSVDSFFARSAVELAAAAVIITGGESALVTNSGINTTTITGPVGSNLALASLTMTGSALTLGGDAATAGDQIYNGALSLGGTSYQTAGGGSFLVNGPATVTAPGPVTIHAMDNGSESTLVPSGKIAFSGTIDGAAALTLTSDSGGVSVGGPVGGTTAPASLAVTGTEIAMNGATTTGGQSYDAAQVTLAGSFATSDAEDATGISVNGATLLSGDAKLQAAAGNVVFNGDIDGGGHALSLSAAGGLAGTDFVVTNVSGLTLSGQRVNLGSGVTATGPISLTGTDADFGISLAGTFTTAGGDFTANGRTALLASVEIDTRGKPSDGAILFTGPGDIFSGGEGRAALTLNSGTATTGIDGQVGASGEGIDFLALDSLTVTAGHTVLGGGVTTIGDQTYIGNVTLASAEYGALGEGKFTVTGATTLTGGETTSIATEGGAISLEGAIDGGNALSLSAPDGLITLGTAGGTTPLASIIAEAATIVTAGATTIGSQLWDAAAVVLAGLYSVGTSFTVTGATTLTADTQVTSSDGLISFAGPIEGGGGEPSLIAGGNDLTLDAGNGDLVLPDGEDGPIIGVNDLSLRASSVPHIGNTSTSGSQTYTATGTGELDGIHLGSTYTSGGAFTTSGHTFLRDDVTIVAAGPVTFGGAIDAEGASLPSAPSLTPSLSITAGEGGVTFAGLAGGAGRLGDLLVSGAGTVTNAGVPQADRGLRFVNATFSDIGGATIDGLDVTGRLTLRNIGSASTFGSLDNKSTVIGGETQQAYLSPLIDADASALANVTVNGCRVGGDAACDTTPVRPPEVVQVLPQEPYQFIDERPFTYNQPVGGCLYAGATDCVLDPNALTNLVFGLQSFDLQSERLRFLDAGNEERW